MDGTLEIRLPEADHAAYLAWMSYWREVERVMLDNPRLAELAGGESAPFLRDPIADYLSHEIIPQIVEQAEGVGGDSPVAPVLHVHMDRMPAAIEYVAKRTGWLMEPGVHEALGIIPPSPQVVDLRVRVLVAVRDQVTRHQARRRSP